MARNVGYERILRARSEPHNWLTYYGAYDGQRYSPLEQINTDNVRRLKPAWAFQCGATGLQAGATTYAFEAAPIVVDGVMYVTGWDGWCWALDARTGQELWRYKHAIPFDVSLCCGNVNRGVAVANGKIFYVTQNAHVIALDAATGKPVWDKTYGDVRAGESATVAPLIIKDKVIVIKDKVIVGSSGGEFGVRGHLDAFDLETGLSPLPRPRARRRGGASRQFRPATGRNAADLPAASRPARTSRERLARTGISCSTSSSSASFSAWTISGRRSSSGRSGSRGPMP